MRSPPPGRPQRIVGAEIDALDRVMRRRELRRTFMFWAWGTIAITCLGALVGLVLDGVDGVFAITPWVFLAALFMAGINLSFDIYMRND
ncbi:MULTISPECIES: hypothetical protein [Nocardiopsis]|uniref:DUF2207 domain-containing protein n=1 Tax=Nocardiopsis changdeensis TaxID=2831969 RepID=A0ABX8BTU4_9ACTN|nr:MULTISPECIES: hypothetical protein [Nocardiopsis]QUX25496.1 hypothetical protein KGD84_15380 [Nocardiopsis changdeensis]QYX35882.1 hypothetical protein K1J57_24835 [Nocardiopsis sp. MT53]